MSLFPNENILTKEIESWKGFADSLNSQEYKELFNKMLEDSYQYATAINTKNTAISYRTINHGFTIITA
jgi:hypothetical protein